MARLTHDLNTLATPNLVGVSIAHDINLYGQIVGQARGTAFPLDRAMVVELIGGGSGHPSCTIANVTSVAYAINDGDPSQLITPLVVGQMDTSLFGPCTAKRGFRIPFDGPCPLLDQNVHRLDPVPFVGDVSAAFDVNDQMPGVQAMAVGTSNACETAGCGTESDDPVRWIIATQSPIGATTLVALDTLAHEARGVNDARNIVGSGFVSTPSCFLNALFWHNLSATPIVLPTVPAGDEAFANAINEPTSEGRLQAVGANQDSGTAHLWERESALAAWAATDLNSLLPDANPDEPVHPCGWFRLIEATDINDNGWIVGFGDRDPSLIGVQERGFLLVPICSSCLADTDLNGTVDGFDLGNVLANWLLICPGDECASCRSDINDPCRADINCDGVVDGIDLGSVLANWTAPGANCQDACEEQQQMSGGGESVFASSAGGEIVSAGPTLEELIQALEAIGLHSLVQLLEEVFPSEAD